MEVLLAESRSGEGREHVVTRRKRAIVVVRLARQSEVDADGGLELGAA